MTYKVMLINCREFGKCRLCRPCCWVSFYSLCWLLFLGRQRKCHETKHSNVVDVGKHVRLKQVTSTSELGGRQRERPFRTTLWSSLSDHCLSSTFK